ncbi:hypothetical protein HMPREF0293_1212 [Corynebacterium glucuronolyticum ATCC 51866]|uniref:Secreted protein n=1 Tax=Corynebacterium glucuronolyticum ATCC 51866 TaxID=548478 RepID=A0ABP2DXC0_9CORY|nr:hypothetical protein HMPREF0293_1212 [Corynebacterium glucuronolyticum ATCC 51866]
MLFISFSLKMSNGSKLVLVVYCTHTPTRTFHYDRFTIVFTTALYGVLYRPTHNTALQMVGKPIQRPRKTGAKCMRKVCDYFSSSTSAMRP